MAGDMPEAEFDVGLDLVERLLWEQHPDLAGLRLAVMANGWDNIIVRAGDELLIRMPRRRVAAFLPGEIAAVSPPTHYHHAAEVLGSFLGGLHAAAPPDAPVNPFRGLPMAERTARFEHQLGMLGPGVVDQAAAVRLSRSGARARP